ncbi:hypothetical protein OU792_18470 [Algoriphagus sp. NF]|nr:hypothetical protein [Algoriphagus sp. NF]
MVVGEHAKKDIGQMKNILIFLTGVSLLTSCKTDHKTKMSDPEALENFDRQYAESMKDALLVLDLDSVKSSHGDRFLELSSIINQHDPIGLLKIGAPEDEYEPEIKTIIVQLDKDMTEQQVHDLIYQEFLRWFEDESTTGPKESYGELAVDIHKWMKK